ncbi:hypothetical protein C7212DRAFT_308244 [Tuber magnatum]|uniref:Uncharacterized protein n=1 Tax=Tuber magnatum TaxID=42249 RepID=A0A317T1K9_9PEZI|nr:hypothetical protein C7212DRAFT_308244 [Tuber magnatum]
MTPREHHAASSSVFVLSLLQSTRLDLNNPATSSQELETYARGSDSNGQQWHNKRVRVSSDPWGYRQDLNLGVGFFF